VVVCLERGADLLMAQLMPLPLTVSCFSKIQIGFTFLVRYQLTWVVADKGPLNERVRARARARARACVCVCVVCVAFIADHCSGPSREIDPTRMRHYLLL